VISDPIFYAVAVVSVTLLGLAKGGFYGLGVMATPLLALVISPLQAAGIMLPILLVGDVISVWAYRKSWDPWNMKVVAPGLVAGVGLGWLLAAWVPEAWVRIAIGAIALAFVLDYWFGRRALEEPYRPSAVKGTFWGTLAGFTSFVAHAGGPPYAMHMLPQRLDREIFAGTTTILFAGVNALKVIPYFALGQLSAENLKTSAVLFPLAVATTIFGVWLVRRVSQELFYRVIYLIMFFVALELLRGGAVGIFRG
jgi:uncharacterized membrane protein YfcA